MKTTVDIPDKVLTEAMRHAKTKRKNAAILAALDHFNHQSRVQKVLAKVGNSETFMTLEELMEMRECDLPKEAKLGKRAG